jgi:hypothetical protein
VNIQSPAIKLRKTKECDEEKKKTDNFHDEAMRRGLRLRML